MSNSTLLYGQLMSYLRQHSRYCDLRHLKALGWMVSALICSGQLNLAAWEPYVPTRAQSPKHRAVAEIHEQRPDSSRSPVSAVSDGGFERVATKAGLFGIRHDGPLGSLLYDSPIGRLLRTSGPAVASVGAQ